MLDSILNENLFEYEGDKYNQNNNIKNNRDSSEANLSLDTLRRNEAKLIKKVPEIRIENNNTTKNDTRFDMPKVNKITFNNLNNFHDEKRKIEGK